METAKNLNFGSDEMQMVITALHDVGRRIKEVGETHKPLFGGELFSQVRRCVSGCISALALCRTIGTGKSFPTRNSQGRFSTRLRTWKGCWKRNTGYSLVENESSSCFANNCLYVFY